MDRGLIHLIALPQVVVSLAQGAGDVVLHRLGRKPQALRNLLVRAAMKHLQSEYGPALGREVLDGVLEQSGSLIRERLPLGRFAC